MISSESTFTADSVGSDQLFSINSQPMSIEPEGSVTVSFALIAGDDLTELEDNAVRAKERYAAVLSTGSGAGQLPVAFELEQNYPNPFNPATTIVFDMKVDGDVALDVYNMLGQKVRRLHSGYLPTGPHEIQWDGASGSGDRVATGVYFYRLSSADFSQTRKMVLLK
jgi:hypothetical protein